MRLSDNEPCHAIMLIDDNPDFRFIAGTALRAAGYDVIEAINGFDALKILESSPKPSLIILDLYMPGMGGFEFRQWQLKDQRYCHIPIIVYSSDIDIEHAARELGALSSIEKTKNVRSIVQKVDFYLRGKHHI